MQAHTHSTTWKVSSIILLINTYAFKTYLKSGRLETKDNYLKGGMEEKWFRTTVLESQ